MAYPTIRPNRLSGVATKDAAQEMAGVWLIEVAEMDVLTRASTSTKKTFLTRRRDRFRPPPHAKHVINLPRQCMFRWNNQSATRWLSHRHDR